MRNKLLKIGILITFLSVLFVQLDLKGSVASAYYKCEDPKEDMKYGVFRESKTLTMCGSCAEGSSTTPVEVIEEGVLIGYRWPGIITNTNSWAVVCEDFTMGSNCKEVKIEKELEFCDDIFVPVDSVGTGTGGTGTGTF